jgi:hypothetical protein
MLIAMLSGVMKLDAKACHGRSMKHKEATVKPALHRPAGDKSSWVDFCWDEAPRPPCGWRNGRHTGLW